MSIVLSWVMILLLFAAASRSGTRLRLIPIVSQLLVAAVLLPVLMLFSAGRGLPWDAAALVAPAWVQTLYGCSFALLLGAILADVRELRPDREALKLALPSFLVPFVCGLACALWLLDSRGVAALALGLVFAITAIPVLYLYLRAIDYPPAAGRRLLQAAILIDLACWLLLGLGQGSLQPASLGWTLLAALVPLPLYALRLRAPAAYGLVFLALLFVAEHCRLNALLLGIGYLACLALLRLPLRLPLSAVWLQRVQRYFAVPLILACGVLKVDVRQALDTFEPLQLLVLIALPILSKLLGNWLGLCWTTPSFAGASKWRESLLLNIRGLSEIVFLNLLLSQQLIDAALYLALMLMSLIATLMPALAGLHRIPSTPLPTARRPHAEH